MKLRSLLFVPADSEHKFTKASACGADALILDLEDSVAPGRKSFARDHVKELLGGAPRDWSFLVRTNPFGTGLTLEDLAAVVRPGLDGILIPEGQWHRGCRTGLALCRCAGSRQRRDAGACQAAGRRDRDAGGDDRVQRLCDPEQTAGRHDLGRRGSGCGARRAHQQGARRRAGRFPIRSPARSACSRRVPRGCRRSRRCMETSGIRKGWRKAAGSRAAMVLSAASPFTPIRSRPSMRASRRPKPIWRMPAASWRPLRRAPTSERSASTARCTTCRI